MNEFEHRIKNLAKIVEDIFKRSGFNTESEGNISSEYIDVIAKNDQYTYFIEIKSPTKDYIGSLAQFERSIQKIYSVSKENQATPVLVVLSQINDNNKKVFCNKYEGLIILDISNLLYAVSGTDYYDDLTIYLPYAVDDIIEKEGEIDLGWLEHKDISKDLLTRLCDCTSGRKDAEKFENVCCDFLKYLFSDDLALWEIQETSNIGLYIDLTYYAESRTIIQKHFGL